MKHFTLAALISILGVSTASADYQTDVDNNIINSAQDTTSSSSFENMQPTAAGKSEQKEQTSILHVPEFG